ncbi:PKD-like domain-containing protein [Fulvivirga lutea]|uniref:Gliding motility-associated C-terminal domain-containing protein n=1 Tax=Fulvivirga lutea TaxID=2810512 RepID=A0A974WHD3_9BACT|nr:PKD-like domain-containing protein [Fulvivirga lutea]QSE96140.1 gliding motility-associated C-terminal domain-containing protein [Fulvivirga lutea]
MMKYFRFVVFIFFYLTVNTELFGQNLVSATHETDNQLQVTAVFDSPPTNIVANYSLAGGTIPVSSVFVSGNTAFIALSSPVPIGTSSFSVLYIPTGSTVNSVNNRIVDCDDFEWELVGIPTPPCAPVNPQTRMTFSIVPGVRNSSNFNLGNIVVRARWNDPANNRSDLVPFESDENGLASSPNNFFTVSAAADGFNYPDNENDCSYESIWLVRIGTTSCIASNPGQFVTYASHNEDNEGGGVINLQPTIANTELVCLNDEANMSFSDVSTLNCINDPDQPNDDDRWVRVIYGDAGRADADRIPNVFVGGVQVTDETGALIAGEYIPTFGGGTGAIGTGDIIGVVEFNDPVNQLPFGALDQITTVSTATALANRDIGDRFYVTIEYWNVCNPYSLGNAAGNQVSASDFLEIIDIPPAPTAVDDIICEGDGLGGVNFTVAGTGGSTRINWYDDDPNTGGVLSANPNGNNSVNFPATSFPGGLNTNNPGIYSMWATYVIGTTNSCESDPVEITVTVREDLTQPGAITGTSPICNNTNNVTFSIAGAPGNNPFGGAIEYEWSSTGGGGVNLDATSGNSITADFNIGGSFTSVTRTIRVRRIYSSAPTCPSNYRTFTVTIFGTTQGGTTGSDNDICEGESTGVISLTGERGSILNWERQFNGGGFIDIGNNGNTSFSEILATEGTYEYRAVVDNGPCLTQTSSVTTITVNPIPATPTITASGGVTNICANGVDQIILQSSNTDGNADEYAWYRDPDLITPVQQSNSNQLIRSTVAQSGRYYVQVIGVNPTNCESPLSAPIDITIDPLPTASGPTGGGSVCSGNPAPDIVWNLTGTAPYQVTYTDGTSTFGPIAEPTNTFTLSGLVTAGTYEITALSDNNGCNATSLGGTASITVGGTAPSLDTPFSLDNNVACDDGASSFNPELLFSLDDANSASQSGFVLIYRIDGSTNRTINFDTDAVGDPTAAIVFNDIELNSTVPSPHDIEIVSIESPAGCLTVLNTIINFTLNPRPADPTGPVNAIACSDPGTGQTISVDVPAGGFTVRWYTSYTDPTTNSPVTGADGTIGGTNGNEFTPVTSSTATFFAAIETDATGCLSNGAVAVTQTEDTAPSVANADTDGVGNNATCNDFYTLSGNIPGSGIGTWSTGNVIYQASFNSLVDDGAGVEGPGPVNTDPVVESWTVDASAGSFTASTDYFRVDGSQFVARDVDGEVIWRTPIIDISGFPLGVDLTVDLSNNGNLEAGDDINVFYRINGGVETLFTAGSQSGNFATVTASASGLTGTTLQIVIRVENNADNDEIYFDNVAITEAGTSAPVFADPNLPNTLVTNLPVGSTDFTWTISSALGVCSDETSTVTITRNPLPDVIDPTPEVCEDQPRNSDNAIIDLTTYENSITSLPAGNRTVTWFTNPGLTINPGDVNNHPVGNNDILYYIIENNTTNCTNDGQITFTVNTLPATAIPPLGDRTFCEDALGTSTHGGVNLETAYNLAVANGDLTNRDVTWFLAYDIPTAVFSSPIVVGAGVGETQNFEVSDGLTIYARVENTITSCVNFAEVDFTVNSLPAPNPIRIGGSPAASPANFCLSSTPILLSIDNATNTNSTYQWSSTTPDIEILGSTTSEFVIVRLDDEITLADNEFLQIVETTQEGCPGPVTQLQIVVETAPSAPSIIGPNDVCSNEAGVIYSVSPANPTSSYAWTIPAGASISGPTDDPTVTINFGTTGGSISVTETNTLGCTSPAAAPETVTIRNRPTITPGLSRTVCSDDLSGITFSTTGVPVATSYQITSVFVTPGLLEDAGNAALNGTSHANVPAGFIANDRFRNLTATNLSVVYTVVPTTENPVGKFCDGNPVNITLTVRPEPYLSTSLDREVCSQEISGLEMDEQPGSVNATAFHYTLLNTNGLTPEAGNAVIPSTGAFPAGAPFDYVINDSYINTTGGPVVVSYTVIPISAAGCESTSAVPIVVRLTVDPEPVGAAITRADQCSDVAFSLSPANILNGLGGTSTYTWVRNPLPAGLTEVAAGTGTGNIAETLQNLTGGTLNATYVVTPTSADGCAGDPYTITVPVDPEPVGAAITRADQCSDVAFSLSPDNITNGLGGTSSYTWVRNPLPAGLTEVAAGTGTGNIAETLQNLTGGTLNATYVVTPTSADGCAGDSYTITVPVDPEPVGAAITRADQCSDVAFSLSPDNITNGLGGTSSYTWVRNPLPAGLTEVAAGTGTGNIAETLQNLTGSTLNATYVVTPTSADGCAGDPYTITVPVDPEPVGAAITRADQCSDVAFSLSPANILNGLGGTSTYTWVRNPLPAGLTEVAAGTGTGNIAETLQNLTGGTLNATYVVTPTSADGCAGDPYTITVPVDPEPVGAAITRADQCSDVAFSLSPDNITNGLGGTSTYTWVRNPLPAGLTEVAAGTGTGNIAETLQNLTGGTLNATYVVTPTSADGCAGDPYTITVPVDPEPVGAAITRADQCSDVAFSLSPDNITNGLGGTSTYTWVRNPLPAGLTEVAAGTGTGNIAETLQNLTGGTLNATYVVTPTSADGCAGDPYTITVPVDPEPVGAAITRADQCSDVAFSLSPDNITNGLGGTSTYTWVRNPLPAGLTQVVGGSGTGNIAETLQNLTGGTLNATYVVTPTSADGCAGDPYTITVPVDPEPVGAAITRADQCSDVAFSLSPDNITNGLGGTSTYTWVRNPLPAGLTQVVGGSGTGNIAETLQNLTGGTLNATYVVTPTSADGCAGDPYTITVPVDPEPVGAAITRADQCSDVAFSLSPDNITNGLGGTSTYTWVRNPLPAGLTQVVGGSGTGNIAETLQNLTGGTLNATYVVTPTSADGCAGDPYTITVPVDPEPVGAAITRADQCSDVAFSLSPDNITNGLGGTSTYTWVRNPLPAGLTQVVGGSGTGNIAETLQNLTGGTLNATYVVTPTSADGCAGDPYTITVPVDPEPVGSLATPAALCSDATLAYNIQTQNINANNGLLSQFTYTVSSDNPDVAAAANRVVPSVDPITDGYINDSGSPANITYSITPFNLVDGCQGDDFDVIFTFNSKPKGFDDTDETCSDVALNYDIQAQNINDAINGNSVVSDFTYSVVSSSGSVPPAPNRTVKSPLPITDTYTNNTGSPVDITYTIVPISQGTNCTGDPFTVTFTIQSEPLGSNTTVDVCGGGAINFNLQGQITNGITSRFYYTVTSSSPADVAPDPDRPIGSASTTGINTSYTNTSGAPVLITYEVTPIANDATNCEGNPFQVRFNIIPGPEGAADTPAPTCSGEQLNYDIQADNVDALGNGIPGRFTYVVSSSNEGVIPTPVSLDRTAASDLPITDTFTNTSTVPVTVTYTITPISDTGGCIGTPFNVFFEITPVPRGGDDLNNIVCSDDPVVYDIQVDNIDTFNGLASEFIYTVTSSDPANVPADADRVVYDAAPINTSYLNTTSSPVFITYSITPRETLSGDLCEGEEFDVRFQINPEPVVNPALDNTVCSDENINVTLATNGVSVNAANYNLTNVTIPLGLTPRAGNVVFPQNGVSATYIRFDRYENLTNAPLTVDYDVIPISASGCQGDLVTIQVEILPEPVLDPLLSPTPVCSGLPSGVILSEDAGSVAAVSYNINGISVPAGLTASAGNANIGDGQGANAIQNDTFINTTSVPLQVIYTIVPVSAAGCEGDAQTVTFTINPSPALANLNDVVCSDAAVGIILATLPSSTSATDYDITDIRPAAGLVPGGSNAGIGLTNNTAYLSTDVFTNNTNGILTVEYDVVPVSGPGCRGPQVTIVITIEPEITINDPADQNICSGDIVSILLDSPTVPSSGNVTFDFTTTVSSPLLTGYTVAAQNKSNGSFISDAIINNTDDPQTVTYHITPEAVGANNGAGCTNPLFTDVVVTVLPVPKVTASSSFVTICEGQNLSIDLTSTTNPSIGTIQFEITNVVATGGVTGFSPIGTFYASSDQIMDAFDNPTTSNQTVTYTITPRAFGTVAGTCSGNPITVVVTVRPRSVVTPTLTNIELCSGESFTNTLSFDVDINSVIAEWTVADNANVDGDNGSIGRTMFFSLVNNSNVPQTLEYIVTPQSLFDASCSGDPVSVFVTVNPIPDVVIIDTEVVRCDGDLSNIPLQGIGTRFEWSADVISGSVAGVDGSSGSEVNDGNARINQVLTNTGTTPAIIRYTIESYYDKTLLTGNDPCEGFVPGFVTLTLSPPVSASIVPHPQDGTNTRVRCTGNVEAVQFAFTGSAPFTLTLDVTDANGITTREVIDNLPSQYAELTSESVTYELVQIEDANGCIATSTESLQVIFEEAIADFEVRGADALNTFGFTNANATVNLDFNSGTGTVEFRFNNFNPANTYTLQIGDEVINVTSPTLTYTFTEPSTFGTLGYVAELQVSTPTIGDVCNDVSSFFIEVLPPEPTVIAAADILEACPPFNVNFESYREDLSLSRNVVVENLVWTINGQTIQTPNPTFTFTQPGVYNVEVKGDNGHGQEAFDNLVITAYPVPTAEFIITQTTVYIPDDGFRPTNRSQGATSFEWDFGDFNTSVSRNPEHFYELEGEYEVTLTAINDFGCVSTKLDTVTVEEGGFTKTPNAFTPNLNGPSGGAEFDPNVPGSGDLANDIFLPITVGVQEFKMWVYDRWGNLIFFSDNKRIGWDGYDSKGNLLPAGVYVYKLDLILSNGQRTTRVGDVTLIR